MAFLMLMYYPMFFHEALVVFRKEPYKKSGDRFMTVSSLPTSGQTNNELALVSLSRQSSTSQVSANSNESIQTAKRTSTVQQIIHQRERQHLEKVAEEYGYFNESVGFVKTVQEYKDSGNPSCQKAAGIYREYISPEAPMKINIDSPAQQQVDTIMAPHLGAECDHPLPTVFDEAYMQISAMLAMNRRLTSSYIKDVTTRERASQEESPPLSNRRWCCVVQ
jgi:Regulator of G protein signaling domain